MSPTCTIAAASYAIAYTLIVHGLVGIADIGNDEPACGICIVTRSVEVAGGVFLITGVLAVTGGYL